MSHVLALVGPLLLLLFGFSRGSTTGQCGRLCLAGVEHSDGNRHFGEQHALLQVKHRTTKITSVHRQDRRRQRSAPTRLEVGKGSHQGSPEQLHGAISRDRIRRQRVRSRLTHEIQSLLASTAPISDDDTLEDRAWERDFLEDGDDLLGGYRDALPQRNNRTSLTDRSVSARRAAKTFPAVQPDSIYSEDYPRDDDVDIKRAVDMERDGGGDREIFATLAPQYPKHTRGNADEEESNVRKRREAERQYLARMSSAADELKMARSKRDDAWDRENQTRKAADLSKHYYDNEHAGLLKLQLDLEHEEEALAQAMSRRERLANLTVDADKALKRASAALVQARKAYEEHQEEVLMARKDLRNRTQLDAQVQQNVQKAHHMEVSANQQFHRSEEGVRQAEEAYHAMIGRTDMKSFPAAEGQRSDAYPACWSFTLHVSLLLFYAYG